jgi:hypothetical protein
MSGLHHIESVFTLTKLLTIFFEIFDKYLVIILKVLEKYFSCALFFHLVYY